MTPLRDLDVAVEGDELVLAAPRPGWCGSGRRRVQQLVEVVRAAGRGHVVADHRGVAVAGVVVAEMAGVALGPSFPEASANFVRGAAATRGAAPAISARRVTPI